MGDPTNLKVYRLRILTKAIHEIGHALSLSYCDYPGCVMYFSTWIGDTDRKRPRFCYRCGEWIERLVEVVTIKVRGVSLSLALLQR